MKRKMKSLYGIYKKHGREAFLDAAKSYSAYVGDTIEDTLAEMESRWYDGSQTMTEAEKMIALNMSANMLGLGNAATPMGISAMKRLDDGSGKATPAMIMLIVLNSTSIQLLPTTVIGLRASAGSTSPSDIILPTLLATICTCLLGIFLVKACHKIFRRKKK